MSSSRYQEAPIQSDPFGWLIGNLHHLLGHDKTATVLGVPPYDKTACVLCMYDRDPTPENLAAVRQALAPRKP